MERKTSLQRRQFSTAILSAVSASSTAALFGDDNQQDSVTKWIRERALPLDGVSPDLPYRDLAPLKRILAGVQVVGVGEDNHGTSEYQLFKYRLFRFLLEETGFTAFALEASYSSCKAINEYVVNGTGRLKDALTSQGYTVWDTLEMATLLGWMRKYNLSANAGKKLRFFGLASPTTKKAERTCLHGCRGMRQTVFRRLRGYSARWQKKMTNGPDARTTPASHPCSPIFRLWLLSCGGQAERCHPRSIPWRMQFGT